MSVRSPRKSMIQAILVGACALTMSSTSVWAQSADAKLKLAQRVAELWHPEDVVVVMVQRPALNAVQQARIALQGRVGAEKRDATLQDLASDVQKYIDQATPIARENGRKAVASTVVPMLVEQFTEDELKQVIAILESPVKKKFEQFLPKMERALGEQVALQTKAQIDPRLQEMTKAVGLKLRAATVAP